MKHYIFDIGGVLINFSFEELINRLTDITSSKKEEVEKLFSFENLYSIETGRITEDDYYNETISPALNGFSYNDWIETLKDNYTLKKQGVDLMLSLKEKGNKIYILSNLAEYNKIAIERKCPEILGYTDHNFFSYELGFFKPEAGIYKSALNIIGADPSDCYFFDDLKPNVDGAEKEGINGFWFTPENYSSIKDAVLG